MARKLKTMDGNNAAAWVSYAFTDVAAIFPITPSSVMAEVVDDWSAQGEKNIFDQSVKVVEMQSEGGAAGAVHGSLAAGALTTTFTASQGLLLMIPNMYKIAGELLPSVIHVSARTVATHALSIFGDHSDVMACRQTGYAMLCATNPQEVMDLGAVAHLSAISGSVPVLHFFDGFRTSHEIQKIEAWDYKELAEMVDWEAVNEFRAKALNPERPALRGSAQNPDIFFQAREACNAYYDEFPSIVEEYMNKVNAATGKKYKLFNYYGARDAEHVVIAMGSVCDSLEETIDYLIEDGEKVGLLKPRLYRPFSVKHFLAGLPKSVKRITVLDRTKEPGAIGEPLYLDVCTALAGTKFKDIEVFCGRYGLSSKNTTPAHLIAVYRNMEARKPKNHFTVGIEDDVTNLSLKIKENPDTTAKGTVCCKFWGLGADGTVGANKNSIKIIGDNTNMYAQAYFQYDSKKSGGITVSHLRFGKKPIKSTYYVEKADFVACHNPAYVNKYDMTGDVKPGGVFLLNCSWNEAELESHLPAAMKKDIAKKNIQFYTVDATHIAREIGLGGRVNMILQAAFFKLAKIIPLDEAVGHMKDAIVQTYGAKGEKVVSMNQAAVDRGVSGIKKVNVPKEWASAKDNAKDMPIQGSRKEVVKFVENIMIPANAMKGDDIPVSAFKEYVNGEFPQGTSSYEKRGIAVDVPEWIPENCIQCNQCSLICPHAVIRPCVLTEEEAKNAPKEMKLKPMMGKGLEGYQFGMVVSTYDCTGCMNCANVCPGMRGAKALEMKPLESQAAQQEVFNYAVSEKISIKEKVFEVFKETSVKGSQFKQPLLEFNGACSGCGETPYVKLVTQLFGDRMFIANATGCTSIWGGSCPSQPYTVNERGFGPAWQNSLFEDNAEFGLGMHLGTNQVRESLSDKLSQLASDAIAPELKGAIDMWIETKQDSQKSRAATDSLVSALEKAKLSGGAAKMVKEIVSKKEYLVKKSNWIFGGDGWAYDIGFGGLDHVIASGADVNILVLDTEVYSNTGGQASKATQTGAVAQFAASGKVIKKKDLAGIAMTYGHVYVAQVAMGADFNQCIKAINEAENYPGPSIVIAYAPCINHGIKQGLTNTQQTIKNAVASGYWHMFRYDPRLEAEGKNPFQLDSKEPTADYKEFIMNEVRYSSLMRKFPEKAPELFEKAGQNAKNRYEQLVRLRDLYGK